MSCSEDARLTPPDFGCEVVLAAAFSEGLTEWKLKDWVE
jgi:hypothetical protein